MNDQEDAPIQCKFCSKELTGVRPVDVMYTVKFPNADKEDPTVFLCDDCAGKAGETDE